MRWCCCHTLPAHSSVGVFSPSTVNSGAFSLPSYSTISSVPRKQSGAFVVFGVHIRKSNAFFFDIFVVLFADKTLVFSFLYTCHFYKFMKSFPVVLEPMHELSKSVMKENQCPTSLFIHLLMGPDCFQISAIVFCYSKHRSAYIFLH